MFKLPGINIHKAQTNHYSGHACPSHYLCKRETVNEERKMGKKKGGTIIYHDYVKEGK